MPAIARSTATPTTQVATQLAGTKTRKSKRWNLNTFLVVVLVGDKVRQCRCPGHETAIGLIHVSAASY